MNTIVVTPTSSTPAGLDSFSAASKSVLKTNIENILTEAFKSTFIYGELGEDGEQIAMSFGKTAAGPLSDTIDDYIKNYIKSQLILLTPKGTLMTAVGPVTGTASTLTSDIVIN